MSDTAMLEQQIAGLTEMIKTLRDQSDLFHEAKGLDGEAEKARKEATEKAVDLQAAKEKLSELQGRKREALQATCAALSAKMSEVLPEGKAIFEISDDGVFIGWERNGKRKPYRGLSGGERVPFDSALCYALIGKGHKVLIMELAEADEVRLLACLNHLAELPEDTQVLAMTCHAPKVAPDGWSVVEVGNAA